MMMNLPSLEVWSTQFPFLTYSIINRLFRSNFSLDYLEHSISIHQISYLEIDLCDQLGL
jgi:hypothetical protein